RITHHNDEAYVGALTIVIAIRSILENEWEGNQNLIEIIINEIPDTSVRDRLVEFKEIKGNVPLKEMAKKYGSTGYVVESVPLAILAAQRVKLYEFKEILKEIINCGGDTDTIASMTGQIIGTFIGYKNLPNEMIEKIPNINSIIELVEKFIKNVK